MTKRNRGYVEEVRELLFQVSEEELKQNVEKPDDHPDPDGRDDLTRGGDSKEDKGTFGDTKEDFWFNHIEDTVDENSTRSRENKMILTRLDLRTTWIMRILLTIVGAVAVTYLRELLLL